MQIRTHDLRARMRLLEKRLVESEGTWEIRQRVVKGGDVTKDEIDFFARFYIQLGRKLEVENMIDAKGVVGRK